MKKILTCAVLCAGLVGFTACNDFLDEEPRSSLTLESYYQTTNQIISNVNYMYRNGVPDMLSNMTGAYRGSSASVQCMLTGYFTNAFEGQEVDCSYARRLVRQDYTQSVCNYQTNDVWKNCYKIINIANGIIKHIDGVSEMSDSDKALYLAETHFFRAWNYFYLVKMFGDVPMVTEPTEDATEIQYPTRTAQSEVYTNVIIPDLKDAVENLPAATFTSNGHRVTKYAAEMVLADVYMMLGQYADAAPLLRDVIENSGASLLTNDDKALNSAYNKLRTTDDSAESIYAYEYDGSIANTGNLPTHAFNGDAEAFFKESTTGSKYSLWVNVFGVSSTYLNVYEDGDLRAQPNQFFHWTYEHPIDHTTITFSSPQNWYWYDYDAIINTGIGTKDWNIYRYAEALVSGAEAIAQSEGVTADAARYLAEVKARASMDGEDVSTIASRLQGMSKQAFIEECWKERLREFPLEMKIWDLCLRTQKFPSISNETAGQVTFVDLIGATNGSGATFKSTDLYWPIPVEEIQRNPNLTQNDGYARQ